MAATHTMAPRVSLGLEDGAEFAEVRAVGVPDGGGQQEAASRGIRLALLLDGCDQPGRVAVLTCSDPPRLRNGCPLTSSTALSRSGACTME